MGAIRSKHFSEREILEGEIYRLIEDHKEQVLGNAVLVFALWWRCKYGQRYVTSRRLAREYHHHRRCVQRFIKELKDNDMIRIVYDNGIIHYKLLL